MRASRRTAVWRWQSEQRAVKAFAAAGDPVAGMIVKGATMAPVGMKHILPTFVVELPGGQRWTSLNTLALSEDTNGTLVIWHQHFGYAALVAGGPHQGMGGGLIRIAPDEARRLYDAAAYQWLTFPEPGRVPEPLMHSHEGPTRDFGPDTRPVPR